MLYLGNIVIGLIAVLVYMWVAKKCVQKLRDICKCTCTVNHVLHLIACIQLASYRPHFLSVVCEGS